MKNIARLITVIICLLNLSVGMACTMYKITKKGKTIVGNNEDWISPNSQFWYETAGEHQYGVMYMGLLNNFAQGAINEAGLVFDGFANPTLPITTAAGKADIPIATAIRNIMQEMSTVEEVKDYLATINLSSLASSQVVFVDKSGTYLIVEGDKLILGEEKEKAFSNFYYSQVKSEKEVDIPSFQDGLTFMEATKGNASLSYCSEAMDKFSKPNLFGTQYSTIYDLTTLTVRVYLFHDYTHFIDIDLKEELKKENHKTMIADLFPKNTIGYQHYVKYNNAEKPTLFLEEMINADNLTEAELTEMGMNGVINTIGYEWLKQQDNPEAAIKVFEYGTSLLPQDADLFDSFGEAYFANRDWEKSIINYAKSLTLDPSNKHAIEQLNRVRQVSEVLGKESFEQVTELLNEYATTLLKKGNLNSISLAVYRDGKSYHHYYGELEKGAGNTPNDETLFEVASISKVFVGTLAAKAVLEKRITLDDDIRKYLGKGYSNLAYEGVPITIKNLLTHTLGFKSKIPEKLAAVNQKRGEGYYENRPIDYNMNDFLEELQTVELDKKPGTVYAYNSIGPELVAYILAQVYQKPYQVLLQEFLDELGMKNTYLQAYDQHKDKLARGYDEEGKLAPVDKNPLLGGGYGIITTLPDLMKLMKFQLESKNPLVKEATRVLYEDDEDNTMGYLWQDLGVADLEGFYYSKSGDTKGVRSIILICPDSNYGQILIVNNKSEAALDDWGQLFGKMETDLIKYPQINLKSVIKPLLIKDQQEAKRQFNILKDDKEKYFNTYFPFVLNVIGYELLADQEINKAIEIFTFGIEEYPTDASLFDSLGEAYFIKKDYKNAVLNYKKSLELAPDNNNAKAYIDKLAQLMKE